MPKRAPQTLRWSTSSHRYELLMGEEVAQCFGPEDEEPWVRWLAAQTSFSFQGHTGRLSVIQEARPRGAGYWYAYAYAGQRRVKRYLGRSTDVTLTRLEAIAADLHEATKPSVGVGAAQRSNKSSTAPLPEHPPRNQQSADWVPPPPTEVPQRSLLLLTTKLHVPQPHARLLSRPHLIERLQAGLARSLTLIAAPAGFGKTTALASWVQRAQRPIAWVSLDAGENDPVQFWTYALTALEEVHPGLAETSLTMLQAPQPPPLAVVLHTLLNAIAAQTEEIVLILDDYHLITEPTIHDSLRVLLEHPPARWHLYLATRAEPPLPLARLRASGQVNEVRVENLRFPPEEAAAFLARTMEVQLSEQDVARLAERTDGWIVGLQLAGLSLQRSPDPSAFLATFGGSHRQIMAYLGEEVLAAQPKEVQTFLLQTSLLERLCGPLCDALTGRDGGQALLERVEQANLFLVALDEERRWYRYHHLFAEFLRHRLHQTSGEQVASLHRRAAGWLETQGWIVEAVEHLLALPDATEATRVLEQSARELLRQGAFSSLAHLIERLPEEVITARPRLCLAQAKTCFYFGRLEAAGRCIASAERSLLLNTGNQRQHLLSSNERQALMGKIALDKANLAVLRGDASSARALSQEALAVLPQEEACLRNEALLRFGDASLAQGNLQAASSAYTEATRSHLEEIEPFLAVRALDRQATVCALQGRLHQAADFYRKAIRLIEILGGEARARSGDAYADLGMIWYEWNDLVAAKQISEQVITFGQQWANIGYQARGLLLLAMIDQAQGQPRAALEALQQAEQLLMANAAFPWLRPAFDALSVRLALRQGRLRDAEQWAKPRERTIGHAPSQSQNHTEELESLTLARVLHAQGKLEEEAHLLEPLAQGAEREGRIDSLIESRALQALIWQARGDVTAALDSLAQALSLAAPAGYVRRFVDEGLPMHSLLARLRDQQPKGSRLRRYSEQLLAAFEQRDTSFSSQLASSLLVEPLSAREREVLHLLAQGRSTEEIARHLVVAVSTVKTHLHHLFVKLQVNDRLQAVTRARELGLFER